MDIAIPEVFIGGLLGACLVFLFSAWACVAVGRSAQAVVTEVRTCGITCKTTSMASVQAGTFWTVWSLRDCGYVKGQSTHGMVD